MDWISAKSKGLETLKKYRYILLVLLAGIFLMSLPEKRATESIPQQTEIREEETLEASLSRILSHIVGAGRVEVLLTEREGEQILYQTDEDRTTGETNTDIRRDTVLVTGTGREETGLVRRIDPPVYQGAIVLCQGAENPKVKLAIVEAVASVTGLTTDKITVLKMK